MDAYNPELPPAPPFSVSRRDEAHVITFTDRNAFDAYRVEAVGEDVYTYLKDIETPKVVLDLNNIDLMSSSALGVLISLKSLAESAGGKLCLANANKDLHGILEMTKLTQLLQVHESVAQAIRSMG